MGNDQSQIKGLEIDKKAIDSNDFWAIFNGELKNENSPPTLITIFQGKSTLDFKTSFIAFVKRTNKKNEFFNRISRNNFRAIMDK